MREREREKGKRESDEEEKVGEKSSRGRHWKGYEIK